MVLLVVETVKGPRLVVSLCLRVSAKTAGLEMAARTLTVLGAVAVGLGLSAQAPQTPTTVGPEARGLLRRLQAQVFSILAVAEARA
jgi:hypothetical protein